MPLTLPQKCIADSPTRFRVAICGRRFGKTYLAIRELARFASRPRQRCWFIAPTRGQAKGIVWEQLKGKLQDLRWISKVNESDLTITLVNGSEISLKSADAYDRMRGYSVSFVVLDEFADMDEACWTAVRPTLSDQQGHALFIGTPRGMGNWSKDMFDMSITNSNWSSFQYTTIEGGQVSEEEIETARIELDERSFREEYLASFESRSGRVFYAFDRNNNVKTYNPDSDRAPHELHIGVDFNLSPLCAVVAVKAGNSLWVIDEIKIYGSNTDELAEEIRNRYPTQRIVCYPDPSGSSGRTSAGGRTDHTILRNAGFTVLSPKAHNPIRDGVNAVNAKLCNSRGETTLYIDPRCKYTIECLERQIYKEGTSLVEKGGTNDYSHMNDALRYMVDWLYPIRQPVQAPEVRMWGHKIATT